MYQMLVEARAWSGQPLEEHHGWPLVHDMLVALEILKPTGKRTHRDCLFGNSCHELKGAIDQTLKVEGDENRVFSIFREVILGDARQNIEVCPEVKQLEPLTPLALHSGPNANSPLPPLTISPDNSSRTDAALVLTSPQLSSGAMTCDETLALPLDPLNDYGCLDKVSAWRHDLTQASIQDIDMEELLSQFPSSARNLVATSEEAHLQTWSLSDWTM
jgi:hypothetical protein